MTPVEWSAAETASAIWARDGQAGDAAAAGEEAADAAVDRAEAEGTGFSLSSSDPQAASRQAHVITVAATAGRNGDTRPPPQALPGRSRCARSGRRSI
jgi:hypothetical protein